MDLTSGVVRRSETDGKELKDGRGLARRASWETALSSEGKAREQQGKWCS